MTLAIVAHTLSGVDLESEVIAVARTASSAKMANAPS